MLLSIFSISKLGSNNVVIGYTSSSNFLGSVTKWAIWIFAILAALFQLGVAAAFVHLLASRERRRGT